MNVYKLPSGSYRVTVKLAGETRRATAPTAREARRAGARLLADLEANTRPGKRRAPGTATITVGHLLEVQLAQAGYAATTLADRKSVVERVPESFKGRLVAEVTSADLDALYSELGRAGLSPFRIRVVHNLLSAAFKRARRWEWVRDNPARSAEPPRIPEAEAKPADPKVLAKIVAKVASDQVFAAFVRLAATSGARRGELCGLQWGDVDLEQGRLTIRRAVAVTSASGVVIKDTKTGSRGRRTIAVDAETVAMLKRLRAAQAERLMAAGISFTDGLWVFSDHLGTRPWRPDRPTRRWTRVCEDLGVTGANLKGLRHLVATQLIAAGVDVETVAGRLGHARTATTLNVYSHWVPERDREAADIIAAKLKVTEEQAS